MVVPVLQRRSSRRSPGTDPASDADRASAAAHLAAAAEPARPAGGDEPKDPSHGVDTASGALADLEGSSAAAEVPGGSAARHLPKGWLQAMSLCAILLVHLIVADVLWSDAARRVEDLAFGVHMTLQVGLVLATLVAGLAWARRRQNRLKAKAVAELRRRLHLERSEADDRLSELLQACDEPLLRCDRQGRVLEANAAAAQLLGRSRASLKGLVRGQWLAGPSPAAESACSSDVRRPDASSVPVSLRRASLRRSRRGEELWTLHDLSGVRNTVHRLTTLANYDSLTGLPNRELFRDRLRRAMERAARSQRPMALIFLDLDRFKVVNDSLGHAVGDELLRHVARTLTGCLRSVDTVSLRHEDDVTISRLGGDEFTVIVENITGPDDAAAIARRMLESLAVPWLRGEEEIVASASIGIALYPTDDVDLDGLLRHTDMAMYRSKSLGRNTFSFFSDDLNTAVHARLQMEGSLRRAIERQEFVLHYQPKADLKTGEIVGMEALLRWNCPGKGLVPPDRFVGVLEDTGLVLPVGAWVIREALRELELWDRAGLPPVSMAVNLSARQLRHQYLGSMIEESLRHHRIRPERLELELTESLLMEDTEVTRAMLAAFDRMGLRLAIDDFGTGHSSLAYLRRFQVDTLKIDRSFVSETPRDPEACAIATAVVALGHSMQMKLVAEGVETPEQARFLRELGCDAMQGCLLSRPLPMDQLMRWAVEYEERRQGDGAAVEGASLDRLAERSGQTEPA